MTKSKLINQGGINGAGESPVNPHSTDFRELQAIIQKVAANQSEEVRMENELLSIRFQIESYLQQDSNELVLAGTFIEKLLKAIKVKKKDFAQYINYEESNLSALLKGRRKINTDIAMKLGQIFKMNPLLWLQIETKNDLLRTGKRKDGDYQQYSLGDLLRKAG